MALGKVYNDNTHPLYDEYKGKKITIEPGAFVEMDYWDYEDFAGQIPVGLSLADFLDGGGNQKPQSFKMIHYEGPRPDDDETTELTCMQCKGKFANQKQLDAHVDEWHLDSLEDQTVAAERRQRTRKK